MEKAPLYGVLCLRILSRNQGNQVLGSLFRIENQFLDNGSSRNAPMASKWETIFPLAMQPANDTQIAPKLPRVWEYTDYRAWLTDTFKARKAIHSWYSYGVLAQRSGFQARDYLLRVMKGERGLSFEGAERLADALDLQTGEKSYFLALVEYNQAKHDLEREVAWSKVQHALSRSRNGSAPRLLTSIHRQILSSWQHLAIRSLVEMKPDPGDWEALGKRLRPRRSKTSVRRSVTLLEKCGLLEKRVDGFWYATDKSIATPPEVAIPAARQFHRGCLKLATSSLEGIPSGRRNISGVMLGISKESYDKVVERIAALREELVQLAEGDCKADCIYQLNLSFFPLSDYESWEESRPCA